MSICLFGFIIGGKNTKNVYICMIGDKIPGQARNDVGEDAGMT